MRADTTPTLVQGRRDPEFSLREGVYRYFFFGWLFRDAGRGSSLERAVALRHNRGQAKWLPVYMRRWVVVGMLVLALEALSELARSSAVLSAALAIAFIFVVLFLLVAATCWAFLHLERGPH